MGTQLRDTSGNLLYRTELDYDKQNRLVGFGESTGNQNYKTGYTYDNDNRVTAMNFDGTAAVSYAYDELGRISTRTVGELTSTYGYVSGGYGEGSTTPLVASIAQNAIPFTYAYDNRGNIISETRNGVTTTYDYDALGQLIRVNDPVQNQTWVFNYDRGGNIVSRVRHAYTTGTLGTALETIPYTYGDANWKDKLTAYNGKAITYDAIGNPLNDGVWSYEWAAGRQLKRMSAEGTALTFKYDHNGLRTQKVVEQSWYPETTNYYLHGKLLTHMTVDYTDFDEVVHTDKLHFFYDAQSRPAQVNFNGVLYTYIHNLQGDIVGLLDSTGALVVECKYDAWGKPIATTGNLADTLGKRNPFRYRGYVYDEETGLYYLRSRYYNPTVGRFVNADKVLGLISKSKRYNAYAYCYDSPLCFHDKDGTSAVDALMQQGQQIMSLDGPYPFADALFGVLLIGAYAYDKYAVWKKSRTSPSYSSVSSSKRTSSAAKTVAEDLGAIAGEFGNFQCVKAQTAMLEYLVSQNLHGTIIELRFLSKRGYVYSNSHNMVISENGFHVGIEYEGTVFCNVHPEGLPENLWICDFEDIHGICTPENITRIAF